MVLKTVVGGGRETIELVRRGVDAVEAELITTLERKVLQPLEVVVQSPTTLVNEHPPSVCESARPEFRRATTDSPSLGHKNLFCVVSPDVGGAQLQADVVRAAGEDEDVASNISDEGLSTDLICPAYKLDWQRPAGHECTLASRPEPSVLFPLS